MNTITDIDLTAALAFIADTHPGAAGFPVLAALPVQTGGTGGMQHHFLNRQRDDWRERAERWLATRADSMNLYVSVADFAAATTRKADNVITAWHLYTEQDETPLPATFPLATYTVETSPGRFQSWWRLVEPVDAATLARHAVALADAAGLSHAAVDASRVLRLPGTINHKRGGFVVRVAAHHPEAVYDLADFAPLLAACEAAHAPGRTVPPVDTTAPILEGGRHRALLSHAGRMRRGGMDADAMLAALRVVNAKQCCPPLEDAEVAALARDVESRYVPHHDAASDAAGEDGTPLVAGPYAVDGGRICWRKRERDGTVLVPLCNFAATITEEVMSDNGAEERGELAITGTLASGVPLPTVRVPMAQFPAMHWPTLLWGTRAIVSAGIGAKDRLREAIQLLSPDTARRTEYAHTGWRRVGGEYVYLHTGGAIGAGGAVPDVAVRLSDALAPFALPEPPEGDALREAVRASLAVLDVAPDAVTVPLLAAAYRAPLCIVDAADTTVALIGSTGAGKSELAALPQQHYGAGFERRKLPGSWESTPNALGWLLFEAKDALAVIDDFKPGGTQQDVARLHQAADRVIRGVGNGAGRGRMRADGGLRPVTPPRGLLLITGEESPRGESLAARMTTVPVDRGAVDFARLTDAQAHGAAGRYTAAMAGYLRWLAPRLDALAVTAAADRAALRDDARRAVDAHARTPDAVATLAYGWRQWLAFALDVEAITESEHAALWKRVWDALVSVGRAQREHVAHEEPTIRFFALLNTALASWQAHIADASGQAPYPPEAFGWKVIVKDEGGDTDGGGGERRVYAPQGRRIGWIDGDHLYLDAGAAHAAAQRVATETNGPVLVPPATLSRRLHERGLLRSGEPSRFGYAVRKVLEGKRRPVLHLHVGVLNAEHDHHDHDDRAAPDSPPYEGERAVGASGEHDQTWQKHDPGGHAAPLRGHSANGVGGENTRDAGGGGHGGHGGHASGAYTSPSDNEQGREGGVRPASPAVPITDAAREVVRRVRLERPDAPPARVEQIAEERLRSRGYDRAAAANALWEVLDGERVA